MSTNDSDKTVFGQSPISHGGTNDRTVIRPSPGRRGSQTQLPYPSEPARDRGSVHNEPPSRMLHAGSADIYAAEFEISYGLNPLVNTASMLIAVFHKTRLSVSHPNVGGLHSQLTAGIRNFETSAREKNIPPEIALAARYIICAALDEAVLNTPWGAESAWTQRTLLSFFHNETNGGEKFFLLLEKLKERPAENLEILELMYILLSLGFEGKYRVVARGRDMIEQIRDELFHVIRTYRGDYERMLSTAWHGLGRTNKSLTHYVPMWVIASIVAGILTLSYSGFRYWLHQSTGDIALQLMEIAATDKNNKRAPE